VGDFGIESNGSIGPARVVLGGKRACVVPSQADHDGHAGLGAIKIDEKTAGLDFGFGRHGGIWGGL